MSRIGFRIACVVGVVGLLTPAFATEQVYHPVSPTFGGNPSNGPFLLSTAQSQGSGVNSGNQGPDLSGLTNALNNLPGTGGNGGNNGNNGNNGNTGNNGTSGNNGTTNSSFRSATFQSRSSRSNLNAVPTSSNSPMP
jgi:curli production assembly/transport component CsgF